MIADTITKDSACQLPLLEQRFDTRIAQPVASFPKQQRNDEKQKQSVNIEVGPQRCLAALPQLYAVVGRGVPGRVGKGKGQVQKDKAAE